MEINWLNFYKFDLAGHSLKHYNSLSLLFYESMTTSPNQFLLIWINFLVFVFSVSVFAVGNHGGEAAIILLLTMIYVYITKNETHSKYPLSKNEIIFITSVILFWLLNLLNTIFQPNGLEYENLRIAISAMDNPMRWLLMLPLYFLFRRYKVDWKLLSIGLSIGVFISVGIASYEVYFLNYSRATGGLNHGITFGQLMVVTDLLLWVFMVFAWHKNHKILATMLFITSLVAFYGSLLSVTRGAWLAYAFMILSFVIYTIKQSIFNKNYLFSKPNLLRIFCAFIVFFLVSQTDHYNTIKARTMNSIEFVTTMGKSNNILSSERIRFDIYRTALKISSHFPFGVGPDNFQNGAKAVIILDALNNSEIQVNNFNDLLNNDLLNSDNLKSDISKYKSLQSHYPNMGGIRYTARWDHAHNEWLNVLAENGVAGIVLLTFLFAFPIKIFWQNLSHQNELAGMYSYCGILLVVSFAIFAQTESIFASHTIVIFFIFFLFLFIAQISRLAK